MNKEHNHTLNSEIQRNLEEAVLDIFSNGDFHQANMRAIARRVGISFGTIYKYYGSKEKLLFSFIDKWMSELADRQIDHLKGIEDLKEKIRKIIWIQLDYYERNPKVGKIIFMSVPLRSWMKDKSFIKKEFMDIFLQVFREGQAKGYLNPNVRPGKFLDFLFGVIIRSFTMLIYRGQKEKFSNQANEMFEMIWRSISNPDLERR